MSVVFSDLVGSTARAERLDPEDVRAMLAPYHGRVARRARAPRRHGREVHRRRGRRRVRRAGRARGRPRARRAGGARDSRAIAQLTRTGSSSRSGSRSTRAKRSSRSMRGPSAGEAMVAGDVINTAARLQTAAPVNGVLVGEATQRATERAIEYREHRAGRGEGQGGARAGLGGARPRARFGVDVGGTGARRSSAAPASSTSCSTRSRALARSASRSSSRSSASPGSARAGSSRSCRRVVDARSGADPLAPGPLAALRGGRQLLGARRDGQGGGGDPRDATRPTWRRAKLRGVVAASAPTETRLDRSAACGRWSGSPATRRRRPARRGLRRLAPLLRGARRASGRRCSSSRTCTGPTTGCSTSSTRSSTGRPTCRSSSSAPRGPSCSRAGRTGAAASRTRPRSRSRRSRTTRRRDSFAPARARGAPGRGAGGGARSARAATRSTPRSSRASSPSGPVGAATCRRRVQGLIAARLDALPRGRRACSRTRRSSARCSGPARSSTRGRRAAAGGAVALARAQGVRAARASPAVGARQHAFRHVLVRDVAYGQIPRRGARGASPAAAEWIESLPASRGG